MHIVWRISLTNTEEQNMVRHWWMSTHMGRDAAYMLYIEQIQIAKVNAISIYAGWNVQCTGPCPGSQSFVFHRVVIHCMECSLSSPKCGALTWPPLEGCWLLCFSGQDMAQSASLHLEQLGYIIDHIENNRIDLVLCKYIVPGCLKQSFHRKYTKLSNPRACKWPENFGNKWITRHPFQQASK